jgi:hypothetical protein
MRQRRKPAGRDSACGSSRAKTSREGESTMDSIRVAAETYGPPRLVINAPRTIGLEARAKF